MSKLTSPFKEEVMTFRIKHIPTGRFFGHPNGSVTESINHIRNALITISPKELKLGTSSGRGKIWTKRLYAEKAFGQLIQITNPTDWELVEWVWGRSI